MKQSDVTRPLALSFSGSDDERAAIKEYCRRQGKTVGKFVREVILAAGGSELSALVISFAADGSGKNQPGSKS